MGSKDGSLVNLRVALRGTCVWEIKKWEEKRKLKWNSVRTEDGHITRLECVTPTDYLMYQETVFREP